MADSLFDSRYRYDYIYPRGRSGETLRAVDTYYSDRPVVIKRPAPNDAPPIRAGQEVSIRNERRALQQLAGHPVLTQLLGEGQFVVGGAPHQYIVMERAEGLIVGDYIRELKAHGDYLPELEALVIADHLLDLLESAHRHEIVYNDVDAKHLFWNRETYSLKVIDWGNAVFLEGDTVTAQGISQQTDVYQVGELLYALFTGGRRADVPRDADESFVADFGNESEIVDLELQAIISRALHPNSRMRFPTIAALRSALRVYQQPMIRERDVTISSVGDKLRRGRLSKSELLTLKATVEPLIASDPGHPPSRELQREIADRLLDLEASADLDAVEIYMRSANWTRAADLLAELREKAGSRTERLVGLLMDTCVLLVNASLLETPPEILEAIRLIFQGKPGPAARTLLVAAPDDPAAHDLQWQISERISSHFPDVMLLRPNLYRLESTLRQLENDGLSSAREPVAILEEIERVQEQVEGMQAINMAALRDSYRAIVDHLTTLNPLLHTLAVQHQLPERRLPLTTLEQAQTAAMALADNMHVIGKQAAASPRDALNALDNSRSIDPTNPIWDDVRDLLRSLYERLQAHQTFVPAADGSDLETWLQETEAALRPYAQQLFDEMLAQMLSGLERAQSNWREYRSAIIQGNRLRALGHLTSAADAVAQLSPALSNWFNQLRSVVTGAKYIERHAIPGAIGRALADGWAAFDRGRLSEAEHLSQQAFEIARTDVEQLAADRLRRLTRLLRDWTERGGVTSASRTHDALAKLEKLFTEDEKLTLDNFNAQMPSIETYLKAMTRGLIEVYERNSTAAVRILFVNYVLLGTLDAHDERLDDSEFWRDAAARTLGDFGSRHVATLALNNFIQQRRDIYAAATLLNQINGKHALPLDASRRQLEENAEVRVLTPAVASLRELETGLKHWTDGDFRSAGAHIEKSVHLVNEAESTLGITLTNYRTWLMALLEGAADLNVGAREMRSLIEKRPDDPEESLRHNHRNQVVVTERLLGQEYAATLRQWYDSYLAFVDIYVDNSIRRSQRLERFQELFRTMFIDRHPAYPLYRHWFDLTERAPEFPVPPTDDPLPRLTEGSDSIDPMLTAPSSEENVSPRQPRRGSHRGGSSPGRFLFASLGVVIVAALGVAGVLFFRNDGSGAITIDLTITDTPAATVTTPTEVAAIAEVTGEQTADVEAAASATDAPRIPTSAPSVVSSTPATPTHTSSPVLTATTEPLTPTATATLSPTATPSLTYTPSQTPLPPEGLRGQQDLLALFSQSELETTVMNFSPIEDGAVWRFGIGTETDGDVLMLRPPLALMDTLYGNNPANRISSTTVDITLRTWNPAIIDEDDVFFGLMLESVLDGANVGVQVQAVQPTVINLAQIVDDQRNFINQRAVNAIIARLRLDRSPETGEVTLYFNDSALGRVAFVEPDAPILPVIFVKDGGVITGVSSWSITLQ